MFMTMLHFPLIVFSLAVLVMLAVCIFPTQRDKLVGLSPSISSGSPGLDES